MVVLISEGKDSDSTIDKALVKRVAGNSRIILTDVELEKFSKQMEDILSAFKELDKVDTKDVKPSFHPVEIKNVLREDVAVECKSDMLSNAVHKEDGYIRGPKIV